MQDKEIHIDKQFTDRAWADMRRRLDEEMPTGERRRRFAWWWPAGLAALVATGLGYMWYAAAPDGAPARMEKPAAALGEQAPVAELPAERPMPASSAARPAQAQPENKATTTPGKTSPSKNRRKTALQNALHGAEQKSANLVAGAEPAVFGDRQNKPKTLPTPETPATLEATSTNFPLQHQPALAAPIRLPMPDLAMLERQTGIKGDIGHQKPQHPLPVGLSVYAGAMSTPSGSGNGLEAGLLAEAHSGRFSIATGVGYSFIQKPLYIVVTQVPGQTTVPTNGAADEVYVSTTESGRTLDLEASFNSITRANESLRLHYVNLPLRLQYKASPRWGFYAGANLAVLLASSPGYTGGGLLNGFDKKLSDEYNLIVAGESKIGEVNLSRFDLSAMGGAYYQFGRRLSLHARYQAGLTDLIKSNQEKEYNRFFLLSLQYRLLGKH